MLTFTIFCLHCNFYFQGRCAFEVSDIVSEQNKNYMHLHSNLIVGTYFFFVSETRKIILKEEKILEKEEIQEKEKKTREG